MTSMPMSRHKVYEFICQKGEGITKYPNCVDVMYGSPLTNNIAWLILLTCEFVCMFSGFPMDNPGKG